MARFPGKILDPVRDADKLFPVVQVFLNHASSSIPSTVSRGKQSNFLFGKALASSLVVPTLQGEHTVKWIEPLERFVDAIVLLWLFDIIFKSVSRSQRLQNGLTKA